ncbi:hypothetical protein SH584_00230 [Sphingomonas sp. LY29]|nr:hypothetical protein [Sphingomonas sp. LY29]WRP25915.1 hypothetical protein SH584_00230 [Sphingomonas sp. LY29]
MKLILGLALIGIIVLAVTMLLRRSGPRITTIEHRRDDEEGK